MAYDAKAGAVLNFDMYRAMAGSAVDTHPIEDDDMADLGGVIKYMHTELLTEHLADPLRTTRKYGIDVLTRHRFKIRNPDKVLESGTFQAMGEFGQFVTFDWGQASNAAQMSLFTEYGDFVGVQMGCADLRCDVRWPAELPYSWFSVGNWCPNLPWDKKGPKSSPNLGCSRSLGGGFVQGGLCPNGFDSVSFVPIGSPTGAPGCTYTYGKAEIVRLDDLAGITAQDCHGGKCKDWAHFRHNCTDGRLRRKFAPSGAIVPVPFCVEFDIHPACEASCDAPNCRALLASGGEAYLGLPWWGGRCDRRANHRRMEQVAAAFGIGGALTTHGLVDPATLSSAAPCPRSKGTSWSCAPEIAGMAGPMCTRSWNGACQQCYIPGVAGGPDPAPRPWCPLDIFTYANYADRQDFPLPKCKSAKPTDGCCLYTASCEGSSDPQRAALSDDGFRLVAARRSSTDMEAYLRRAAQGRPCLGNAEAMKWASYFAWDNMPVFWSLSDVLRELNEFAAARGPLITRASTVTLQTLQSLAGTAQNGCYELTVSFMPLDMAGTVGSIEASAEACQERCAKQAGCRHFSFMQSPGVLSGFCHLQDLFALPQLGSIGFLAGPQKCDEDLAGLVDVGHKTFVSADFACFEWGVVYSPPMPGSTRLIAQADGSDEQAVRSCQAACLNTAGCARFAFALPSRICSLVGAGATKMVNAVGAISGPPRCSAAAKSAYYRRFAAGRVALGAPGRSAAVRWAAGGAAAATLAAAALAVAKVFRSGPERALRLEASRDDAFDALIAHPAL